METTGNVHRSIETRLDQFEQQMNGIAQKAHPSTDVESRLRSCRIRLAEIRTRLREKQEADDRAYDEGLAALGRELNEMSAHMFS